MEGRWTIYKASGQWDDVVDGPDTGFDGPEVYGVGVVPCDDAAVERARLALENETYIPMNVIAKVVQVVLRAAGETP